MRRKSDNYSLVLASGGLGLWILFHTIWNILFEDWLKHQLEHLVRHTLAEMIERFGSVGFPALAAIAVVWFLSSYISAQAKAELASQPELQPDPRVVARKTAPSFDSSWTRDVTMLDALWRAFSGNGEFGRNSRPPITPVLKSPDCGPLATGYDNRLLKENCLFGADDAAGRPQLYTSKFRKLSGPIMPSTAAIPLTQERKIFGSTSRILSLLARCQTREPLRGKIS